MADTDRINFRLRRDAGDGSGRLGRAWSRRRVRWLVWLGLAGLAGAIAFWFVFVRDLPSVEKLRAY